MRKFLTAALCVLLFIASSAPALAAENSAQELSLQEAIEKAIAHSRALRISQHRIEQAELDVEAASENADSATAAAVYAIASGDTSSNLITEAYKANNSLAIKEIALQSAKKDYQAQKDSVVISVYQAYYGVLLAEAALDAAKLSLEQADLNYRAISLKHQFGFASSLQLKQEKGNLDSAKQAYASAEKSLAAAYEKLNRLVGLAPDDRPVLTDKPSFSPLEVASLDAEIARALNESPSIWKAEASVEQAEINLDSACYSPITSEAYKSLEIAISIAEENAASEKEKLAESLRSIYRSIQQLEEEHAVLENKLAAAEEAVRLTELKHRYGRASRLDLLAAQSAVASIRQSLLNNECQHAILVQAFKTPWAYGG